MSNISFPSFRKNIRILVFNVNDGSYSPEKIVDHIERSRLYHDWWNRFPGVFLVKSALTPSQIVTDFDTSFENSPAMFCVLLDLNNSSQKVDEMTWRWLLDVPDHVLDKSFDELRSAVEEK